MSLLKCVLLVDDNPNDTELLLGALQADGLADKVVPVRDGVEALDFLYRRGAYAARTDDQPTVILLDLKMPRVGGLEVLRQIKGDPRLKVIPVVVLTSSREEQDLVDSYQLGVNAYVVKPVNFREFVDAVRRVGGFWAVLNEPPPEKLRRFAGARD